MCDGLPSSEFGVVFNVVNEEGGVVEVCYYCLWLGDGVGGDETDENE
jgi:hypothetical protein